MDSASVSGSRFLLCLSSCPGFPLWLSYKSQRNFLPSCFNNGVYYSHTKQARQKEVPGLWNIVHTDLTMLKLWAGKAISTWSLTGCSVELKRMLKETQMKGGRASEVSEGSKCSTNFSHILNWSAGGEKAAAITKRPALLRWNLLGSISSGSAHRAVVQKEPMLPLELAANLGNV